MISEHMRIIVGKLLEYYPTIECILLAGGYGRGEGSVILLPNGRVKPLGDYDIFIVTNSRIHPIRFNRMIKEIARIIQVSPTFLSIEVIPKLSLRRLNCDISKYELKVASKVLYGKDLHSLIPVKKEEVALSCGFITLSNRAIMMSRLLEIVINTPTEALSPKQRQECMFYCAKVFTEICTALSLLEGFYEPSYAERAELFQRYFDSMKKLKEEVPELPRKIKEYTEIKLFSAFDKKDLKEAILEASFYLRVSFLYFISKYLGVQLSPDDWHQNARLMYKGLRLSFLQSYVAPILKRKKLFFRPLVTLLTLIACLLENTIFVARIYQATGKLYLRPLLSWSYPAAKTYIATNLAFFSVDVSKMEINPELLREAYNYLIKAYPCNILTNNTDWSDWNLWKKISRACAQSIQLFVSYHIH